VLLASLAQSSPVDSGVHRRTPQPVQSWAYQGCYTEPQGGRALHSKVTYNDAMTVELCAASCAGFKYFGLEYRRECWCGDKLESGSVKAPTSDCKYTCQANPSQNCGGDDRLSVVAFESTPATAAYISEGCYSDKTSNRALTLSQFYDDAMTVEKCAAYCKSYTLFGLEYGRECYCGNAVQGGNVQVRSEDCSFPCAGNSKQTCGAGDGLNLYRYGTRTSTSTSRATSSTSTTRTVRYVQLLPRSVALLLILPEHTSDHSHVNKYICGHSSM
jgi:hypothetical protein